MRLRGYQRCRPVWTAADPGLVRQAKRLDARGQQLLLEVVFDAETPAK
jgi:hypothetical protein